MTDPRAKLYINTGVVTNKTDVYNILRPLLKQTVTYTYFRGNQVTSSGTGWVERIVVDHPDVASYFTPLSICLNLDSFDYLQFDTTSEQLLIYTLVIGSERVVLEFSAGGSRLAEDEEAQAGRPLPRNAEELARDLRLVTQEMPLARSVAMGLFVGVGSRHEQGAHAGLSHMLEHLVFKGTQRFPDPGELSEAVEGCGGSVNASTDRELTVYSAKVPAPAMA